MGPVAAFWGLHTLDLFTTLFKTYYDTGDTQRIRCSSVPLINEIMYVYASYYLSHIIKSDWHLSRKV